MADSESVGGAGGEGEGGQAGGIRLRVAAAQPGHVAGPAAAGGVGRGESEGAVGGGLGDDGLDAVRKRAGGTGAEVEVDLLAGIEGVGRVAAVEGERGDGDGAAGLGPSGADGVFASGHEGRRGRRIERAGGVGPVGGGGAAGEAEERALAAGEAVRRGGGDGDQAAVLEVGAGEIGGRAERAGELGDADHRFALLAVAGGRGGDGRAGFVVEQDGFDDGGQVAADAGAVVVELGNDAVDVAAAGRGGDQSLDELAAEEGAEVRVLEDLVVDGIELLGGERLEGGVGEGGGRRRGVGIEDGAADLRQAGEDDVVEQALAAGEVAGGDLAHRFGPDHGAGKRGPIGAGVVVAPAGEDVGVADDGLLVVDGNWQALRVEDERAVGMEAVEAEGEELEDLAGVVFVRDAAGGEVRLVVAQHVEIAAHRGMEGDRFDQVAGVAEGVLEEGVVVVGQGLGAIVERAVFGDDHDLAESEGDALAELVVGDDRMLPPRVEGQVPVVGVVRIGDVAVGLDVRQVEGGGLGDLRVDPGVEGRQGLEGGDVGRAGAEGGLLEEAGGGLGIAVRGERVGGPGRWRWWRGVGGGAVEGAEEAFDLAAGVVDGVDVEEGVLAEAVGDFRGGQRAGVLDVPDIGSVGEDLDAGLVEVEDDVGSRGQTRVVDVHALEGRAEIAEGRGDPGGGLVGGEAQGAGAVGIGQRAGLRGEGGEEQGAVGRGAEGDVFEAGQHVARHDLRGDVVGLAGLGPAEGEVVTAAVLLVEDFQVVAAACFEAEQGRSGGTGPVGGSGRAGQGGALPGVDRFLVVREVEDGAFVAAEEEAVVAAGRCGEEAADPRAVCVAAVGE